jgi:cytochrome c biogenesis protein CcdA/thiol-disulfide isomerase/thioredoxin
MLLVLAFVGGVLTILSPCILPVLPFVFARADRPFLRSGLPMLVGMAATFALVASLAAVVGGWAVQLNQWGRVAALALLALFGLALIVPSLADRLMRPLQSLGGRLSERADDGRGEILPSLLLGAATGLLWAPCAGPILGLIFTGAAIKGASAETTLLLLAYALGAALSLGLALLAGGRVYGLMKRSLGAGVWVRRGLGVLVLVAVVAIALGADTGFLTRVSSTQTAALEQGLLDRFGQAQKPKAKPADGKFPPMPPLAGATAWINSPPLTPEALKGRVVVVDFWTYSCINCLRATPHVKAWAERYGKDGLTVIGVHTPEFAFEKSRANVEKAVRDLGIAYPVAMDDDYKVWKAYDNGGWPTHYFIDAEGRLRDSLPGEGQYDKAEAIIRTLLAERNGKPLEGGLTEAVGQGAQAAPDIEHMLSPETWLGYDRITEKFASPGGVRKDVAADYVLPKTYTADAWGLAGRWRIGKEAATGLAPGGRIAFRFQSRDLHMVLGTAGRPVRFRIRIDGKPPGADHGLDADAKGEGVVTGQRLYQLVRQRQVREVDHTFEIEFLDPGVQAYTFTFG